MTIRSTFKKIIQTVAQKHDLDIGQVEATWWHDRRSKDGLRLTTFAYECLLEFGIEFHSFGLDADLLRKPKILLDLDRRMSCAYYLQTKKPTQLILFGSREAMMLALYSNIEKFLANTLPRSSQ